MRPRALTIAEVEFIAFTLARELMAYDESIPEFGTRFPNVLESCLKTPFSRFGGRDLYRGIIEKASILFYLMIKNHPFENGNKRVAVMTLFVFLRENKRWLEVSREELYNFAKHIAESDPKKKSAYIFGIQKFLSQYIVPLRGRSMRI